MTGREELEKSLIDISKIADNLQERIDKAIEYINKHIEYGLELGKILHDEDDELRNNVFFDISEVDEILNILKGSDKE